MPTKAELGSEVVTLRAKLSSLPPANYMQRVNPNLIALLHYTGLLLLRSLELLAFNCMR